MVILGVVFAGAVVGMGGMGYLGDIMGRKRAYCLTMFFIVLGSLGAAVLPWGPAHDTTDNSVFMILAVVRFVLGVGVGGLYPLSAVKAAESTSEGENITTRTAKAFFWQTPGAITPYIVGWIIVQMCRNPGSNYHVFAQLEFRLIFGLGAIFPMYLLLSELRSSGGADDGAVTTKDSEETIAKRSLMMKDKQYWKQLIGTGGTWFLFDIAYYGTAIFQPQIVNCIFQPAVGHALTDDFFWHNIVVSLAGIPGVLFAIWAMKHIGARNLGLYGFLLIALGFGALAICFQVATDTNELKWVKFGIFCFCNFMLNCGPNISTYVLPAVLFPFEVRSTFHGLSAGAGKIGAVVGTFMYPALASQGNNSGGVEHGIAIVLWVQVFFAILGALATVFCLPDERLLAKQKKTRRYHRCFHPTRICKLDSNQSLRVPNCSNVETSGMFLKYNTGNTSTCIARIRTKM